LEPHDPRGVPGRVSLPSGSIHAARLLEGLSTAVARDLPDRAIPSDFASREDAFSPDQHADRTPSAPPVDAKHKGRGYELTKGKYVQIDEDELKAIQVESTHTIDIDGFVPRAEIDKRYLDRPYYIAPNGKTGAEAFVVIRDALQDEKRVALARIVMAHREHMIMLEPLGKGLLGTTLRYDYEVRSEKDYFAHIPSPRISKDMVSLAAHILENKATKFDPGKFQDEYEKALRKLVQRKAKGHAIKAPEPEERPSNVVTPHPKQA
jgi:DNA end-binding protein Ku